MVRRRPARGKRGREDESAQMYDSNLGRIQAPQLLQHRQFLPLSESDDGLIITKTRHVDREDLIRPRLVTDITLADICNNFAGDELLAAGSGKLSPDVDSDIIGILPIILNPPLNLFLIRSRYIPRCQSESSPPVLHPAKTLSETTLILRGLRERYPDHLHVLIRQRTLRRLPDRICDTPPPHQR